MGRQFHQIAFHGLLGSKLKNIANLLLFTFSCTLFHFGVGDAFSQGLEDGPRLVIDAKSHHNRILETVFSPDGEKLYTVSLDKTIRVWNSGTGQLLKTFRRQVGDEFAGSLTSGAISPDGKFLAVGGRDRSTDAGNEAAIIIIDLTAGEIAARLEGHSNTVTSLAFSPTGTVLASGSLDTSIRLWNTDWLAKGEALPAKTDSTILQGHSHAVYALAFGDQGNKLMSASLDTKAILWDTSVAIASVTSGKILANQKIEQAAVLDKHSQAIFAADISADGSKVVTGDVGGSLYLWDGVTGKPLGPLAETGKTFSVLKISPDGKEVFASSRGADGGTASIYQLDPENPKSRDLPVKSNRLTSGDWNRTSDLLAFSDGATQSIEIWNPKIQTQVIAMKSRGRPVTNAAFFTDPELIQVGFTILPDGVVDLGHEKLTHVFDFQNLKLRKILPQDTDQVSETYNAEEFLQVKRSSDPGRRGSTLQISGGIEIKVAERSNQIRDWSYTSKNQLLVAHDFGLSLYSAKGEELRKFRGHEATVRGAASSFDGKYAVSGSEDRTVRLWNLETGDPDE